MAEVTQIIPWSLKFFLVPPHTHHTGSLMQNIVNKEQNFVM